MAGPWTGGVVVVLLGLWVAFGLASGFAPPWQSVLNSVGWVVALTMLFLIQHAQRKDTLAIQLKLNELVKAVEGASERLVAVERLDHEDLEQLQEESEAKSPRTPRLPPARDAAKP